MTNSIYRVTEVIGTSADSWEDAARHAVETAARRCDARGRGRDSTS
jgi:flavin-binding protein dodecin